MVPQAQIRTDIPESGLPSGDRTVACTSNAAVILLSAGFRRETFCAVHPPPLEHPPGSSVATAAAPIVVSVSMVCLVPRTCSILVPWFDRALRNLTLTRSRRYHTIG